MALHMGSLVRKDIGLIPSAARYFILFLLPAEGPKPALAIADGPTDTPALPYFQAYPAFLIGDLPPPRA
jgi:hypothetical protein